MYILRYKSLSQHTFSKIKLIKNSLRKSMGQSDFSNIVLLKIEKEQSNNLDMDQIINQFVEAKAKNVNLLD